MPTTGEGWRDPTSPAPLPPSPEMPTTRASETSQRRGCNLCPHGSESGAAGFGIQPATCHEHTSTAMTMTAEKTGDIAL